MNAQELLGAAGALPGVRSVTGFQSQLRGPILLSGIEVAEAPEIDERAIRRLWRERHGGGATPLLLLSDDPGGAGVVRALGPLDVVGLVRSVDAGALLEVFERIAGQSRLEAVRELTSELDRLDQAGIPGLKVRDLLTLHTLDVRLRSDDGRRSQLEDAARAIPSRADWRGVLVGLGYQLERRPHRGWLVRWESRPVAVVHPKPAAADFARLDEEGRPPEGVLLNDCRSDGATYGLLVSGGRLRLFEADPAAGSAVSRYLDVDANALREGDRFFLGLLSPPYLAEGLFTHLLEEARAFGAGLRRRLDERIRHKVLPTLGWAVGRWARERGLEVTADSVREDLERAALTLIFRALFLLYAEGARFLPMDHRSYRQASLSGLVEEAAENIATLDPRSTSLWDRFVLLVKAMRTGNAAWGVPAYNGALFAPDGFEGAATLEALEVADPDFGQILVGLGRASEDGAGLDYSTLEIGHLGHIYEGLLSLRLSVADAPLRYDPRLDRYRSVESGETPHVESGDLLWQTHEGGRKGGGVYYTRSELVRHLVRETVVPAFRAHLESVRETASTDPAAAADKLFDFAVLDPACGSAHFLVEVVNELADLVVRFLAEVPLPQITEALDRLRAGAMAGVVIEDVALLRRLALKRCVFGVDLSPMGAEIAKLSLWLASFVPGLSLAYLDRNVQVGNSLVGVARPEALLGSSGGQASWLDDALEDAMNRAAAAVLAVAESEDRTPDEIGASKEADSRARAATAGLELVFHAWTAEPFGVARARHEVELHAAEIIAGATNGILDKALAVADEHDFLHWPIAFPRVFSRERPGFDVVVGNPPWNEITVEEQSFYALFRPGIRRGIPEEERARAVAELVRERPELPERLKREQERAHEERAYFAVGEYESMPGDPDLYKFFCQRYRTLLRDGGRLGVVLPRTTFVNEGSAGFRVWLFEHSTCDRLDFLLNKRLWMFESHPQFTVALVAARGVPPGPDHRTEVAGTATSLPDWEEQSVRRGLRLPTEAYGPGWTVPLLRSQAEADLLAKLRHGSPFPLGSGGRWRCFSVRELDETNDRLLWRRAEDGWPLWKGESFDQYNPHGAAARLCPTGEKVMKKVLKPRPGAGSLLADRVSLADRRRAVVEEVGRARVAFHDVTQKDNSRTVIACLIPPETFLTNKAPYLAFANGGEMERAACLGIMNSLPFDWQARRFVEVNLNFFILEGLIVPEFGEEDLREIAQASARLSAVDERFQSFGEAVEVEVGPLTDQERDELRLDIDLRVARAWAITPAELDVMFSDFTLNAVPAAYRRTFSERLSGATPPSR